MFEVCHLCGVCVRGECMCVLWASVCLCVWYLCLCAPAARCAWTKDTPDKGGDWLPHSQTSRAAGLWGLWEC